MEKLSALNKFKFVWEKSMDIPNELRGGNKERDLVMKIKNLPSDTIYVRHIYNPDWASHGVKVNLVNMVRDPIDRMASWFYFVRLESNHDNFNPPGTQSFGTTPPRLGQKLRTGFRGLSANAC
jgi:hypothetical protein